jgi:hypothetical protein
VKFQCIPDLGVHSLVWDEAPKIGGQDPGMVLCLNALCRHFFMTRVDFHRKDLN